MWGALTFLLLFLVIDPTTRDVIIGVIEEARARIAVEAPWPYFLMVIVVISATVSTLIMRFWPSNEEKSRRIKVLHRYQGQAASDLPQIARPPALMQLVSETASLVMPGRARAACGKLLRNLGGLAGIRLRGA